MINKICFIVNSVDNQRCRKRVEEFKTNGYKVSVYGFSLGINANKWDECEIIGSYGKTHSIKRAVILYSSIKKLFCREKGENVLWYYFGFDIALFSILLNFRNKFIYEESDLVHLQFSSEWFMKFLEWIDKLIIKKSCLSVMTSEGFLNYHYGNRLFPVNTLVKPNKLNPQILELPLIKKHPINFNQLNFAFVGMIRYPAVRQMADVISSSFPNHYFHFYGVTNVVTAEENEEFEELGNRPNVFFHGKFNNPTDLPSIYSSTDVVISTYDISSTNVLYAEPNKLYEAIFFNTPIIVSRGTFLEMQVKKYKCGYSVDPYDENEIKNLVYMIEKNAKLGKCMRMDVDQQFAVDQCEELMERVKEIEESKFC